MVCEVHAAELEPDRPRPADNECGDTVAGLGDGGHAVSTGPGLDADGNDFGNQRTPPPPVRGTKFNDTDGDGTQDAGESGLEDWEIRAYADDGDGSLDATETTLAGFATTNANGNYSLSLDPGDYVICELAQPSWEQTAPEPADNECGDTVAGLADGGHAVSTGPGLDADGNDFGNQRTPPPPVRGTKFNDTDGDGTQDAGESGLEDWEIRAYADDGDGSLDATETTLAGFATTNANGNYSLSLDPGDYVVCELAQPSWKQTAPEPADNECGDTVAGLADGGHAVSTGPGLDADGNDFGNQRTPPPPVRGTKFNDTDGDGTQDAGESGLEDWEIRAYADDGDGSLDATETTLAGFATTNANGNYSLSLDPGDYVVCELAQPSWNQTAPEPADNECGDTVAGLADGGHAVSTGPGLDADGNDFGNQRTPPPPVRGTKFNDTDGDGTQDAGESGLEDWEIRAYADDGDGSLDATETTLAGFATTNANGNYSLSLDPGDYVVCELAQPSWEQTAPEPADNECGDTVAGLADGGHAVSTGPGLDADGNDFGNQRTPPPPVRGTKFNDTDGDGTQDAGESGLEDWEIRAYADDGDGSLDATETTLAGFATTNANGNYSLSLDPGDYVVCELAQPSWTQTAPEPADNECGDTVAGLADGGHAVSTAVDEPFKDIDFGNQPVPAELELTKRQQDCTPSPCSAFSAAPINVDFGDQLRYSLAVENQGSGPATDVVVRDALPAGVDLIGVTPSEGASCTEEGSGKVRCIVASLAPGVEKTIATLKTEISVVPDPCTIIGTSGNDSLTGTTRTDTICGLGGSDTINAAKGDDTVWGDVPPGSAEFSLPGPLRNVAFLDGNDDGERDASEQQKTTAANLVVGTAGDDTVQGQPGHDTIQGQSGDDYLRGGPGPDEMFGGTGHDALLGGDDKDRLAGGAGKFWNETSDQNSDLLAGGGGPDLLLGQGGRDGNTGAAFTAGAPGGQQLYVPIPQLQGGGGRDYLHGGPDDDTLHGGDGGGPQCPPDCDLNNVLVGGSNDSSSGDLCSNGPLGSPNPSPSDEWAGTDRGDIRDPSCERPAEGQSTAVKKKGSRYVFYDFEIDVPSLFNWDNF